MELNSDEDMLEKLMDHAGMNGKFQVRFNLLFNLGYIILLSMPCFNIFLALTVPEHWCHVPGRNETNFTLDEWKELTLPKNEDGQTWSKCDMYSNNTTTGDNFDYSNVTDHYVTDCRHGWEYDTTWYKLTVPSQEDWVCDKRLYVTNALFFCRAGEAIGTMIFGQMGDTVGRRPVMFVAVVTLVVFRCLSVLAVSWYYLFLAACFIGSSPSTTVFVSPLIIGTELTSREQKGHIAMLQCIGWTAGMCMVPIVAWATGGEWKALLVASTVPCLSLFLIHKLFPESPRWLALRGKTAECVKVLHQIADLNGKVLTKDAHQLLQRIDGKKEEVFGLASLKSSWRLARNTCLVCACVILCHLIYYSVILLVTNMSGNPFLNFFLQAVVEFPGFITGRVICDRLGRRWGQAAAYSLSVIVLLSISIVINQPGLQWLLTCLVVSVKFCITTTVYASYLLNTEIYPTCVRQTGTSVGFTASSTLGVLAPYIAYLGNAVDVRYPYVLLAMLAALGALCSLLLPETLHQRLPETLADAARFGQDQKFWNFPTRVNKGKTKCTALKIDDS